VRVNIRNLTRFLDPEEGLKDVYTNFEDEIGEDIKEFNVVKSDSQLRDYHLRVQRFIRENKDHITIRRLVNNEPISHTDIQSLENILFAEGGPIPRDEYEKVFGEEPLGRLVRSVAGLNRKAAKEAFAEFLNDSTLSPDQISFLDKIVDYICKNGIMEPKVVFETPFTHINSRGVIGVFGEEESKRIIARINEINGNADVA